MWQLIHLSTIRYPRVIEEVLVSTITRLCTVRPEWFLNQSSNEQDGLLHASVGPWWLEMVSPVKSQRRFLFPKMVPGAKTLNPDTNASAWSRYTMQRSVCVGDGVKSTPTTVSRQPCNSALWIHQCWANFLCVWELWLCFLPQQTSDVSVSLGCYISVLGLPLSPPLFLLSVQGPL